MQYILTEDEYNNLNEEYIQEEKRLINIIQKLCVQIAENQPILFWGNKEPDIWGCNIHGKKESYGYCDECPAQKHCPEPNKKWSK